MRSIRCRVERFVQPFGKREFHFDSILCAAEWCIPRAIKGRAPAFEE